MMSSLSNPYPKSTPIGPSGLTIAAPKPKRFWPLNERCHITKASVAASSWLEPGAIDSWLRVAQGAGADVVIPRVRHAGGGDLDERHELAELYRDGLQRLGWLRMPEGPPRKAYLFGAQEREAEARALGAMASG